MNGNSTRFLLAVAAAFLLAIAVFASLVFFRPDFLFPSVPRNPPMLEARPGNERVALNWKVKGEGITGWEYRQGGLNREYGLWQSVPSNGNARSYVIGSLANGEMYFFQVRAKYADKAGWPSNEASAVPIGVEKQLQEIIGHLAVLSTFFSRCASCESAPSQPNPPPNGLDAVVGRLAAIETELKNIAKLLEVEPVDENPIDKRCEGSEKTIGEVFFLLESDELFPADELSFSQQNKETLIKILDAIKGLQEPDYIVLEGHASEEGAASYNLDLSERRAHQVKDYLEGCLEDRLEDCPEKKDPIAKNWNRNFIIVSEGESHDEADPRRYEDCNRKVRVVLCQTSP